MPSLKLTYIPTPGPAEAACLAFYIGGVPFKENRINVKGQPLGQPPVLEVDGVAMTQPYAILRYAAWLSGLYPTNSPYAALKVDEFLHALSEMEQQFNPIIRETDVGKKKELCEELATVTFPRYARLLSDRLEKMQQLPIFQSAAISVHELAIFAWVKLVRSGCIEHVPTTTLDSFKLLAAVFRKVDQHAKVKEWLSLPHDTPKLRLIYPPFPGRAEPIRLAFYIGDIEFEDVHISITEVDELKQKLPFHQVPVLEIDGEVMAQSQAILRYAGSLSGLYPTTDPVASFKVDEVFTPIDEMHASPEWRKTYWEKDPEKLRKLRAFITDHTVPKTLDTIEKLIVRNDAQYSAGETLTVADLAVYTLVLILTSGRLDGIPTTVTDTYPSIQRVFHLVKTNAKVIDWYATKL